MKTFSKRNAVCFGKCSIYLVCNIIQKSEDHNVPSKTFIKHKDVMRVWDLESREAGVVAKAIVLPLCLNAYRRERLPAVYGCLAHTISKHVCA